MFWLILGLLLSVSPVSVFAQTDTLTPSPTSVSSPTPIFTPTNPPTPTPTPIVPSSTPSPTPTISLSMSSVPGQSFKGSSFNFNILLSHAKANNDYYFKVYGGVSGDNYSIEVQGSSGWPNGYNGSWTDMPKFTTNSNGDINQNITVRSRLDKPSGQYTLTAKAKDANSSFDLTSPSQTIQIIDPSPTSTPQPTSSPTPTPSPTDTPTTSASATSTPVPTKFPTRTPTPTEEIAPTLEPTATPDPLVSPTDIESSDGGEIMGITDLILPTPTPKSLTFIKNFSANLLPGLFITSGALLILVPVLISKLHK